MNKTGIAFVLLAFPAFLFANPTTEEPKGGFPPFLIKVGSDAACDYTTLFAAMNAAGSLTNVVVRVAKNVAPQNAIFTTPEQLIIEGGYDTCSDTTPSGRTVINGTGAAGSVISMSNGFTNGTDYNVTLRNLQISGGVGTASPARGGGITIRGPLYVLLQNTVVRDNSTPESGGGVLITGAPGNADSNNERTSLQLAGNSEIKFNEARKGGGIACEEKASVSIYDAAVNNNEVTDVGGGLYSLGCFTVITSGRVGFSQGIFFNEANGIFTAGGGIYADSGNVFLLGNKIKAARVFANNADLGAGIYLRNNASLYSYNSEINSNTAVIGGGVYADNATTVIARTLAGANCHDEMRCSQLSDNWATAAGGTTGGGGGAVYAIGGTTRISGTFIEKNRAFGGRGMAVRAIDAEGTNTGFDQNGLRILGSVIVENTNDGGAVEDYESVVEFKTSSGEIGFTTFARNSAVPNIVYTPAVGTFYEIDVYGSIFDASSGNVAGPGSNGPVPNGDCNRLHETTSNFAMNSLRSNSFLPGFVDPLNGDYRLGGPNMVDWCDASYNNLAGALSADGGTRPYDNAVIPAMFGNWDLGGLERHPLDLIFRNGFDPF